MTLLVINNQFSSPSSFLHFSKTFFFFTVAIWEIVTQRPLKKGVRSFGIPDRMERVIKIIAKVHWGSYTGNNRLYIRASFGGDYN